GQADQVALRSDARSEVCNLDGELCQLRRALSARLLGLQRCGQNHSCRRLCSRLSAASGGLDRGPSKNPGQDHAGEMAGKKYPGISVSFVAIGKEIFRYGW